MFSCKTDRATFKYVYVFVLETHHHHQQDLQNTVLEDHGPNQSVPRKERVCEYVCMRERVAKTTRCFFLNVLYCFSHIRFFVCPCCMLNVCILLQHCLVLYVARASGRNAVLFHTHCIWLKLQ